jgi:hypothetical protein
MPTDVQHFVNISVFSYAMGNGQTFALFLPILRPKLSFCIVCRFIFMTIWHIKHLLAVQCSRRLVSGLSPRRPESGTGPFCVRFVVEIVAEGQVCLSTSVFFCQCHSSKDISLFLHLSQMPHNLGKTQHH